MENIVNDPTLRKRCQVSKLVYLYVWYALHTTLMIYIYIYRTFISKNGQNIRNFTYFLFLCVLAERLYDGGYKARTMMDAQIHPFHNSPSVVSPDGFL